MNYLQQPADKMNYLSHIDTQQDAIVNVLGYVTLVVTKEDDEEYDTHPEVVGDLIEMIQCKEISIILYEFEDFLGAPQGGGDHGERLEWIMSRVDNLAETDFNEAFGEAVDLLMRICFTNRAPATYARNKKRLTKKITILAGIK